MLASDMSLLETLMDEHISAPHKNFNPDVFAHFYFVTNDHYGETLLQILCDEREREEKPRERRWEKDGKKYVVSRVTEEMAEAFKLAIIAGRKAYLAGLGRVLNFKAEASSPLIDFLEDK